MVSLKIHTLFVASVSFLSICFAQQNITVKNTSPLIHYEGNALDAPICQIINGTFVPGRPGCYLISPSCTDSVTMGQGGSGAASFSFKGSAIYITSALNDLSPIYTVSLDGKSVDVDGVRPSAPFTCSTLFSQTDLDPNVEHQIRLSIRGPSPTRNQTAPGSESRFVFSLISFIYTEGSVKESNVNASITQPNASEVHQQPLGLLLGMVLAFGWLSIRL